MQETYLVHHGILGQKWGIRRYQNPDGTLTEAGKKRQLKDVKGNRKATITKGTELYRISSKSDDTVDNEKIYATVDKEQGEFYKQQFVASDMMKTGEAYVQKLIAKNDIVLPDKKTMENMIKRLAMTLSYITFPLMFILLLTAKPIFVLLYSFSIPINSFCLSKELKSFT